MVELFLKGGPIMWPLLLCSLIAATVAIERLIFALAEAARRDPARVHDILASLEQGNLPAALQLGTPTQDLVVRALHEALTHPQAFASSMLAAAHRELRRYQRGLNLLDTIITLAPLLGLLGTVTGMIRSFGMLGGAELGAPSAITGGIAEALIATAFGLGVAITALLPFNYLNATQERARADLEEAASRAELLLQKIRPL